MTQNNDKEPELRQISDEDLKKVLDDHKKWLDSSGKEGEIADLSNTDLSGRNLEKAYLFGAHLEGAEFFRTHLEGTNLSDTHLEGAILIEAHLEGAILIEGANLENANVTGVTYDGEGLYRGIRVSTCYGSPIFKRFAQDQDWLEEYLLTRETRWQKILAYLWKETCDYGQSFTKWAIVSLLLAVIFGSILYIMGLWDSFHIQKPLPEYPDLWGLFTMLYYSVITFTTLGFGDVTPKTLPAAAVVMAEVIFGYIMLGGLISIFATKLARRS